MSSPIAETTHDIAAPEPTPADRAGSVRWRRFAAMLGVSTIAGITMVLLTAQGVLAAQFSISGMPFTVTAKELKGDGFEQYAVLDQMPDGSPNAGATGGQMVLVVSAIGEGDITDLCQSVSLGGTFLKLTAGTGSRKVHVSGMLADSDQIDADIVFDHIDIGQDASTLDKVPGAKGNLGVFGQQARAFTITDLNQRNYAVSAASFTLPNLRMRFTSDGC